MSAKSGKLVVLSVGTGQSAVPVMSARTNSFTVNHTTVDVTTKKDAGFAALLSGGGITEVTCSLEGIFLNETYDKQLEQFGFDGSSNAYTLTTSNGAKFEGNFIITAFTVGGTYNEAQTYSFSLKNDGAITYTPGT